jgi:hypothetical protein
MHQPDRIRIIEHRPHEAGVPPQRGRLGGDPGNNLGRRIDSPVPPSLGHPGPPGVSRIGVDQRERPGARVLISTAVVEDLHPVGDRGDHEVLMRMPHKRLPHIPGPQ